MLERILCSCKDHSLSHNLPHSGPSLVSRSVPNAKSHLVAHVYTPSASPHQPPLRTSPTCLVSWISPDHTRLNPLDLIPSHPKSPSEPQSVQPHILSGMQQLSTITWSSRDDRTTMRQPRRLIGRPTSRQSWDLGVPTLFLFNLFPSYCMLMLR